MTEGFIGSREEFAQKVILLRNEGMSIHGLARRFGVSRNTVRKILRAHADRREKGHDLLVKKIRRRSKLDVFEETIKETLTKYPKITGQRLYETLRDAGYEGGISILRDRLTLLRPKKREPIIRFEIEPGLQGQMDWSPYTIPFTRTGKATVQCFSYILGYSRRQYIDFTLRHDFYTLVRRHQDAFMYFNGVPRECLYDNEKTVVLRWEAGRPVYNPGFTAFITHYNCKPVACRPKSPWIKGKVEAPFQYVEKNLLGGRMFQDMEDLRATARWWLAEKSDLHIHDTTKRAPLELFQEERLQPLPLHPYDTSETALRVCDGEGLIEFETNRYSVPSGNIGDILTLKATEHEVFIYNPEVDLIATHERAPAGSNKRVENPEHIKPKKDRYGLEPVREAFLAIGDAAHEFLTGLMERYPRNCGFHARYVLRLKEHYETDFHAPWNRSETNGRSANLNKPCRRLRSGRSKNTVNCLPRRGIMKNQTMPEETVTRIRQHLTTLKLTVIRKALDAELAKAAKEAATPTQLLERLLALEANALIERRIERRIRESKLPERKLLSDFDFVFQTGVDKAQIMELAKLDFVERKQGLVLAGRSGTGKSHLAKALLLIGCKQLRRCRYTTAADMLTDLLSGLGDNSLHKRLRQYTAPDTLLIDEIGFDRLEQHDARNASLFFKVIDGRYCKGSTLITTNIAFKELGDYLGDPVVTTAIVDRMIHHSVIINIEGPSWRMHESKKLNAKTKSAKTK